MHVKVSHNLAMYDVFQDLAVKWTCNLLQYCGLLLQRLVQCWPVSNHQVLHLAADKPGISKSSLVRVR